MTQAALARTARTVAWLLAGITVISACAPGRAPTPARMPAATPERAAALATAGDFTGAARLYLALARDARPPRQQELQLKAADALLDAGRPAEAREILAAVSTEGLDPSLRVRRDLLGARAALAEQRPAEALALLPPPPESIPADLKAAAHRTRATAYEAIGNLLEAARERVFLDPLLADAARAANRETVWRLLTALPAAFLAQTAGAAEPGSFRGWLDLALLVKTRPPNSALAAALEDWRDRHPLHPAADTLLIRLLTELAKPREHPNTVALLLPLSGRFAGAGAAVRDGFLAAYYADRDNPQRPTVRVYDVGERADMAWAAYRQAMKDGAGFVVGPLDKDALAALARAGNLEVPVLALNLAPAGSDVPSRLYQFGLPPEEEAAQAAERASLDGHFRALAIVPQGTWGERVLAAFRERFEALGGELAEFQTYPRKATDFAVAIRRLLNLDESEARYRRLKHLLKRNLKYEPRRRQDVDFIFMAAFPREARLLRPQLKFHHASDLPVYGTSHVYTGHGERAADQDMDGVVFCDMPWVLVSDPEHYPTRAAVLRLWPDAARRYLRFYAFGTDAYRIIPYLDELGRGLFGYFPGATGDLYLDEARRIHRRLRWARFEGGVPRLMNE